MTTVHRLLDDAFAGVELTPEVQDLKEEIRANLEARTAELQAGGTSSDVAARRAFDELGDVRALAVEAAGGGEPSGPSTAPAHGLQQAARSAQLHQVRPKPAFVVNVVITAAVTAALATFAVLGAVGILSIPVAAVVAWAAGAAFGAGWIVGTALVQETTTNHPMPGIRAAGYGAGRRSAAPSRRPG
jgi:hypothetical protein